MSKKVIFGILSFVLLAGSVGAGVYLVQRNQSLQEEASPASTLKLTPASKSNFIGESVTVTADIDTTTNFATGATIDIKFSADKLTLTSIEPGTALPVVITPASIDNNSGSASISLSSQPSSPFQGKGIVTTLKFTAKSAGTANISFGPSTTARGDKGKDSTLVPGTDILVAKSPTSITILTQGTTSTSPSETPALVTASALPSSSPSTTTPTPSSGGASASTTPSASSSPSTTKPTITLPTNGKVVAGSTISGTAVPNSTVTITIRSETINATVKADSTGKWSYKIPQTLENGTHTITITDSSGTVTKSFVVTGSTASGSASQTATSSTIPVTGNEIPTIIAVFTGIVLLFVGIAIAL